MPCFSPKLHKKLDRRASCFAYGCEYVIMEIASQQWEEGTKVKATPDIGSRIRELRERSDLSLRALAEICNVSPNTVSLIERGLTSPCVDTLQRLATGLRVPITALFETEEPPARLVLTRSTDRMQGQCPGMRIEHLASGLADHAFASFSIAMEPGSSTNTTLIEHTGVEWVYCLEGHVLYEVDGCEYRLAPGDTLLFDASLPHRWRNPNATPAHMLLVLDAGGQRAVSVEQHFRI